MPKWGVRRGKGQVGRWINFLPTTSEHRAPIIFANPLRGKLRTRQPFLLSLVVIRFQPARTYIKQKPLVAGWLHIERASLGRRTHGLRCDKTMNAALPHRISASCVASCSLVWVPVGSKTHTRIISTKPQHRR